MSRISCSNEESNESRPPEGAPGRLVRHTTVPMAGAMKAALAVCGDEPSEAPDGEAGLTYIVGRSEGLRRVVDAIRKVAPTDATVLVLGESGTGKELVVRAIHELSPRADGPFVAINCAALPENLIESTLFGHERGAFTGAHSRFVGAFERAHGGTLFLDEISELRLDLQAKLLRAIQERRFERVGGDRSVGVDVRVVVTSNRDLATEVREGRFRKDLYYRLGVVPIQLPPLRQRPEDIPALVSHFADRYARGLGIAVPEIPAGALRALVGAPWPGNVRELEHAVERALILCPGGPLDPEAFFLDSILEPVREIGVGTARDADSLTGPRPEREAPGPELPSLRLKDLEQIAIDAALRATGGNRTQAAGLLGISDRTLRNKLRERREAAASPDAERMDLPPDAEASSVDPAADSRSRSRAPVKRGLSLVDGAGNLIPRNAFA
jgi:DNA-binding NtrC family response regulator